MFLIFLFLVGLGIGSFLNVVVYRLNTGEGVVYRRSRCFACGATLSWQELIPVASFFAQKGKCRHCGSRIAWQYPIVEVLTATILTIVFYKLNDLFSVIYTFIIFSFLITISVYDLRHKIIPNQLVYPCIFLTFLFGNFEFGMWNLFENWKLEIGNLETLSYLIAGFFAFSFFALLWLVSRGRWMGFGDAKLAAGIGFFLGPYLTPLAMVLSFWLGAIIGVVLLLVKKATRKSEIPFAPFLALGAFLAWLVGDYILSWYFSIIWG